MTVTRTVLGRAGTVRVTVAVVGAGCETASDVAEVVTVLVTVVVDVLVTVVAGPDAPDVWVDSERNGFGTLAGGTDSPWAGHENHVFVRVRNDGKATARNLAVDVSAVPLGPGCGTGPEDDTLPPKQRGHAAMTATTLRRKLRNTPFGGLFLRIATR